MRSTSQDGSPYYKRVSGTLTITKRTMVAAQAGGYSNVPGMLSDEWIKGWLPVRRPLN
jgi:2,4-dienoyl-CoA reductase-like NADH-dependent reductase (Old Yellow Enzyme family)